MRKRPHFLMFFLIIFFLIGDTDRANAQIYLKLEWMEFDSAWGVFARTDSTIAPSDNILIGSGQVTVVAPTGFPYDEESLDNKIGFWEMNSRANAPVENPDKDYLSFGLLTSNPVSDMEGAAEVLLFSFKTINNYCPASLYLIEEDDPFAVEDNSYNANPGNDLQMLDIKNNQAIYQFSGTYGHDAWYCGQPTDDRSTSLTSYAAGITLKTFPNPFASEVVFTSDEKVIDYTIQFFDQIGRTVQSVNMTESPFQVVLEESGNKLYHYRIFDKKRNVLLKSGKILHK